MNHNSLPSQRRPEIARAQDLALLRDRIDTFVAARSSGVSFPEAYRMRDDGWLVALDEQDLPAVSLTFHEDFLARLVPDMVGKHHIAEFTLSRDVPTYTFLGDELPADPSAIDPDDLVDERAQRRGSVVFIMMDDDSEFTSAYYKINEDGSTYVAFQPREDESWPSLSEESPGLLAQEVTDFNVILDALEQVPIDELATVMRTEVTY